MKGNVLAALVLLGTVVCELNGSRVIVYNKTDNPVWFGVAEHTVHNKTNLKMIPARTSWPGVAFDRGSFFSPKQTGDIYLRYEQKGTLFTHALNLGAREFRYVEIHPMRDGQARIKIKTILQAAVGSLVDVAIKAGEVALEAGSSIVHKVGKDIINKIKQRQPAIVNNPYKNTVARVRSGSAVGKDEALFRKKRLPLVKYGQEAFLGMQYKNGEKPLEVVFSCSGGGWRAMVLTTGSFVGAEKIGLLPTLMYASGLSGSTWFLGPWLSGGPGGVEPTDVVTHRNKLLTNVAQGLQLSPIIKEARREINLILDMVQVKFAFNQSVNVIDLYGALIANNLLRHFGDKRQIVRLSDQAKMIGTGKWPMPIYTVVWGEKGEPQEWGEMTPFESGSRDLGPDGGMWIPTWAFGRAFDNGVSIDFAPEQSLGFAMGMFGSAIGVNLGQIYKHAIKKMALPSFVKDIIRGAIYTGVEDVRFTWADVNNFVYKMPQTRVAAYKKLKLIDAGIDFMNPVFVLYRKTVNSSSTELANGGTPDIIFVLDCGSTVGAEDLYLQAEYAQRKGFKFPLKTQDFKLEGEKWVFVNKELQERVLKRAFTVFKDENDSTSPVVIYMPRIVDEQLADAYKRFDPKRIYDVMNFDIEHCVKKEHCTTFNLQYSVEQAERIAAVAEFNIRAHAEDIKQVMRERIQVRRNARDRK